MITKRLSPKGRSMRVYFDLPPDVADRDVHVVGDFNDWDRTATPMQIHPKDGVWRAGVSFKPGTTIQFKYLVDGREWRNDEEADAYVPNEHGTENSLLRL